MGDIKTFLTLLAPFAPHICEELWHDLGLEGFVVCQPWPVYDPALCIDQEVEVAVQVNGKFRGTVWVPADCSDDELVEAAAAEERIQRNLEGMRIVKTIVVKNKLINLLVKP